MIRIDDITDKVSKYIDKPDLALIHGAYVFAAKAHHGVMRRSGEPYISHPLSVAYLLAEMELDEASVAAGLLHDTVEDTDTDVDEIHDLFGEEVADIVDGVTKISLMTFSDRAEAQAENIRKMILAMAEDIRVIMIKLADRLHNMRTLEHMKPLKQRRIAQETKDIYSPLANRLGLHRVKIELEDLCLRYLKPDVFEQLNEEVAKHHTAGQGYIDKVLDLIRGMLDENNIKGRVFGRTKHLYSTYTKMQQQGLSLDEVYDLIAFRIVVPSLKDCYAAVGLVHSIWKPVHGRFKDYIATPKANLYQSLHTTVIGPDGERIEIQIRTEEMHRVAEYGVAAHWQYKETGKGAGRKKKVAAARDAERYTWLKQIMDWQREFSDAREFMAQLRFDLFEDEVYVFTPAGEVKELPEGATPVDFAYSIHTEVGDRCAGAKVNGKLVSLPTKLQNGDRVEIITDKNHHPSRDWLKFIKTAKARTRVKNYIRTEERARAVALAKEILEKEGRKRNLNVAKAMKDGTFSKLAEQLSCGSSEELLAQVGYAHHTPNKVLNRLYALLHDDEKALPKAKPKPEPEESTGTDQVRPAAKADSIKLSGIDNILVRFASCCNPIPGEPIIGYITRGRGVTVHRTDCSNIKNFEAERLLNITWEGQEDKPYPAAIRVVCLNEKGMLAKICGILNDADINIDSGSFLSNVDGSSNLEFTVEVKDLNQLYEALAKIKSVKRVKEAVRVD